MTMTHEMVTGTAAVRLLDLHKTYREGSEPVHALRGVCLSLRTGSVTAVMGQSGSGKSTLLQCAAGLDSPTRGQVIIENRDISGLTADELTRFRRERIGFVFQDYNLIGHLDVLDNIQLPLLLAGRSVDPGWQAWVIEALGLAGLEGRLPGELSGGQAQRVAIARALVTRPAVVFADEPTGALDSGTGVRVLETLTTVAERLHQTVVLVTHDSAVASAAARVVILADGTVVDELDRPTAEKINGRMLALGR